MRQYATGDDMKKNEQEHDVIRELSRLYFERTGTSPEYSFYAWLDAAGVDATTEGFQDVLDNPDKYFDEVKP